MGDILIGTIIIVILGLAIYKLYWNKKNNIKCSGCPHSTPNGKCNSVNFEK